jgi:hypothetical protein
MNIRLRNMRKWMAAVLAVAVSGIVIAAIGPIASSGANENGSQVLYSSLVSPYSAQNPPNEWWSLSFGGTQATQFGDKVNLASSSRLGSATVMLDSQACQTGTGLTCVTTKGATFPVSIMFTIYRPGATGGTVGAVLATQTKTFNVPYRPSANPTACAAGTNSIFAGPPGTNDGTQWLDPATGTCYYGVVYPATFRFEGSRELPTTVVYGVSYDATSSVPASSLNVLMSTESASGAVTVGSDTDPGNLFVQARSAGNALGGPNGQITCSAVVGPFAEYNTAMNGTTGCGTDTYQADSTTSYLPIAFVPAVEIDSNS